MSLVFVLGPLPDLSIPLWKQPTTTSPFILQTWPQQPTLAKEQPTVQSFTCKSLHSCKSYNSTVYGASLYLDQLLLGSVILLRLFPTSSNVIIISPTCIFHTAHISLSVWHQRLGTFDGVAVHDAPDNSDATATSVYKPGCSIIESLVSAVNMVKKDM